MKREDYNKVVQAINKLDMIGCLGTVQFMFPQLSPRSLSSIYSQLVQHRMKRIHHTHNSPDQIEKNFARYNELVAEQQQHALLTVAKEIGLSPALLARMILDRYLSLSTTDKDTDVPDNAAARRQLLSELLRDVSLIKDPVLAANIEECHLVDDVYGPLVDNIKYVTGLEFEIILQQTLDKNAIAYSTQEQLRASGYDKTPDFKLDIPISVDGVVINWIESKASFGDSESNATYLKDQFYSYWNRFGSGMVIYWFGFIEDLNNIDGIMITDHFPDNFIKLSPILPKLTAPLQLL